MNINQVATKNTTRVLCTFSVAISAITMSIITPISIPEKIFNSGAIPQTEAEANA